MRSPPAGPGVDAAVYREARRKLASKAIRRRPRPRVGAEGAPDVSRGHHELPPFRTVGGREAVLKRSAYDIDADLAVDACLHVIFLRGRDDAARDLFVRQSGWGQLVK